MKRIIAVIFSMFFIFVACNDMQNPIDKGDITDKSAYFKDWSSVVSDGTKTCYVANDEFTKRSTIYDQGKQSLYATSNDVINLYGIQDGKLYFLDAKMKTDWAFDFKVLDLGTLQTETLFKLPRDNCSFINPIFYNGYAYYQDTGYESNIHSNSLIYFPIYNEKGINTVKFENKTKLRPTSKSQSKELVWKENRDIFVIGIVNDRIYYTYEPNNSKNDRIDQNDSTIVSCNLDGTDRKILLNEKSFGEEVSFERPGVKIDGDYLYVSVESESGAFFSRLNINTLELERFPIDYNGYLSVGKDHIYLNTYTENSAVYKINKKDMSVELFLDKYVDDLVVTNGYLYFKEPYKVPGKKNEWVDKLGRIKEDGTGFELLE